MCGINGIIGGDFRDGKLAMKLQKMYEATKNRGLNQMVQQHNDARISFNWLKITDTTLTVMPNEYNGTTVYLNGYISNYRELANKYGIELDTDCDIEFLAKFISINDKPDFSELNGFFAILAQKYDVWFIFTDRYGVKQLYIYKDEHETMYISSELKGILAVFPHLKPCNIAVDDWKKTLGVVGSDTIYGEIIRAQKLPFHIPEKIEISYEDAKLKLSDLLHNAFKRNRYKGKTGVFLSGGIDSGIIAKHMKPDYSFSVDYVDDEFSETELIKKNSTGTHLSIIINEEMAKQYAYKTMSALDDLKAGSCYTNFAIAELASKFVKVVHSGAGGDEFFGGYPHRKNKYIGDVIQRTSHGEFDWRDEMSHFEYDLKFLDAILVVEDRMSGFHTMETRYPLLDNELVDFALSLPDEYVENKRILKDVSGLHTEVINGKKKGFSNPYFTNDEWVDFTLKNLKKWI